MKKMIFVLAIAFSGFMASQASSFAGDASGIQWSCSASQGYLVTGVVIENGEAYITTYSKINEMAPMTVGGPYQDLVTFGGGDFIGVKSIDGSFSLIAGSLRATLNDGSSLSLDNVVCRNAR